MSRKVSQHNVEWTEALVARLTYLWDQGVSATQIAALMGEGLTKNGIIGKVHRLRLPLRNKPWGRTPHGVRRSSPRYRKKKPRVSRAKAPPGASLPLPVPDTPKPPPPPPAPLPAPPRPIPPPRPRQIEDMVVPVGRQIPLLDLGSGMCKWPVNSPPRGGTYLFCGEPQFNGWSYCEYHSRIGFVGTKRQERVSGWQPRQAGF